MQTIIRRRSIAAFSAILLCLTGLTACDDKKEDVTDTVNKAGAIETSVSVQHADSTHDVILTTHKVWVNFNEYKTIVHKDTVPALGIGNTVAENADGDTKSVKVPKDYEIFITVK
ncbi:MAG TPA: hypothetical protein VGM30_21280 [Puia sp.]|jgi:hypothetical protein